MFGNKWKNSHLVQLNFAAKRWKKGYIETLMTIARKNSTNKSDISALKMTHFEQTNDIRSIKMFKKEPKSFTLLTLWWTKLKNHINITLYKTYCYSY